MPIIVLQKMSLSGSGSGVVINVRQLAQTDYIWTFVYNLNASKR